MGAFSLIVVINLLNRIGMSPVKSSNPLPSGDKLNLVDLPFPVIEAICKYLMQKFEDILNLRLTCSALYRIVNACRLELVHVDLAGFAFSHPWGCDFPIRCLNHISDKTNWRIVGLTCSAEVLQKQQIYATAKCIAGLFKSEKIELPFLKEVKLELGHERYENSLMVAFVDALNANQSNGKFEVYIRSAMGNSRKFPAFNRCIPEATAMNFRFNAELDEVEAEALVNNIVKYFPNLKTLKLKVLGSEFDIEWFKPLKNLTHLEIDDSEILRRNSVPAKGSFENLLHLEIDGAPTVELLDYVPNLKVIVFLGDSHIHFGDSYETLFNNNRQQIPESWVIDESCIDLMKNLTNIKHLTIDDPLMADLCDCNASLFQISANLRYLALIVPNICYMSGNSKMSGNEWKQCVMLLLRKFKKLEYLDITYVYREEGSFNVGKNELSNWFRRHEWFLRSHPVKTIRLINGSKTDLLLTKFSTTANDFTKHRDIAFLLHIPVEMELTKKIYKFCGNFYAVVNE